MLEMMRNILREDSPELSERRQRSVPMLFASAVPCEDSVPLDSSDQLNLFEEDFDDSEECGDLGRPRYDAEKSSTPVPCANPLVPMDHPCFIRVVVLRTPLMRHDPCTNFSLSTEQLVGSSRSAELPNDTNCSPNGPQDNLNTACDNSTASPVSNELATTDDPILGATLDTTTEVPSTTDYTSTVTPPITTEYPTTTYETTTKEIQQYVKRKYGKRRNRQRISAASVPDAPNIKVDGVVQSSEVSPVYLTAELTARETATTMRPEAFVGTAKGKKAKKCSDTSEDEEATTENVDSSGAEDSESAGRWHH